MAKFMTENDGTICLYMGNVTYLGKNKASCIAQHVRYGIFGLYGERCDNCGKNHWHVLVRYFPAIVNAGTDWEDDYGMSVCVFCRTKTKCRSFRYGIGRITVFLKNMRELSPMDGVKTFNGFTRRVALMWKISK